MNVAAGLLVALTASAIPAPSPEGASLTHRMAQNYAAEVRGAATFVVETRTDVRAGPMKHAEVSETAYAEVDGAVVGKSVLRSVNDGAVAKPDKLAKLSAEPEGPLSRFGMRLPISEAADDYQFSDPHEHGDRVDVDFITTVKDAAHGNGMLTFDLAEKRIAQVVDHPVVLPPHATSMTVTIDFGRVGDGRWDIVKITRTFAGREGIMTGKGTAISVYDHYQTHATTAEALKALSAIAPSTN